MSNKHRDYQAELEGIMDGLAESIEAASPEELLEEAEAAGQDPRVIAERTKERLLAQVKRFEQRKLEAARLECESHASNCANWKKTISGSPGERRRRLLDVLEHNPQIGTALTTQHRNFEDLSDEDVESALEDLTELGFLGASTDSTGKE